MRTNKSPHKICNWAFVPSYRNFMFYTVVTNKHVHVYDHDGHDDHVDYYFDDLDQINQPPPQLLICIPVC